MNIYQRILMNQYAIMKEKEEIKWDDDDWHPNESIYTCLKIYSKEKPKSNDSKDNTQCC